MKMFHAVSKIFNKNSRAYRNQMDIIEGQLQKKFCSMQEKKPDSNNGY
jgi:hypothetical protein